MARKSAIAGVLTGPPRSCPISLEVTYWQGTALRHVGATSPPPDNPGGVACEKGGRVADPAWRLDLWGKGRLVLRP